MTNPGKIVIISGPSGSGKTSVIRLMMELDGNLALGLSATTRKMRPTEKEGVNYRFVSTSEFEKLAQRGELIEQAVVHSDSYGTLKNSVDGVLAEGRTVVLDVDVIGAKSISKMYPAALTIYLLPPSEDERVARIQGRGTESEAALRIRVETAKKEKKHIPFYKYTVVNNELEKTAAEIMALIKRI